MNYILALIPTRFHDRAKAVIGLLGIVLTLALAIPSVPVWLPIVAATLTAYGIYQVPNSTTVPVVITVTDEGDIDESELYNEDPA